METHTNNAEAVVGWLDASAEGLSCLLNILYNNIIQGVSCDLYPSHMLRCSQGIESTRRGTNPDHATMNLFDRRSHLYLVS